MARHVEGLVSLLLLCACVGDSPVGGPTDASADSPTTDAGGGDAAKDAAPTFCTGQTATKCIDFDGPGATFPDYLSDISSVGSAATLDVQDFHSAPQGMRATMLANTTGVQFASQAGGVVVLPSSGKRGLTADFWMRINPYTLTTVNDQVAILVFKINAQDGVTIAHTKGASADTWSVTCTGPGTAVPMTAPLTLGTWAHYVLTMVFDVTAGTVRLDVDGVKVAEKTGFKTTSETTSNSLSAFFGTTSIFGKTPQVLTRVDDILLTVQ